jgi:hypothetical protein
VLPLVAQAVKLASRVNPACDAGMGASHQLLTSPSGRLVGIASLDGTVSLR